MTDADVTEVARGTLKEWPADIERQNRAVRYGARVAHEPSGVLSNGHILTMCGRTLSPDDPRYKEVDVTTLPQRQHCLRCWG